MLKQFPSIVVDRLDYSMFDVRPGVIVVEHDVILLARTFGFDSEFQAIELSQIDVAVKVVLLFPVSIRNRPFMLHIVIVPPVTERRGRIRATFGLNMFSTKEASKSIPH